MAKLLALLVTCCAAAGVVARAQPPPSLQWLQGPPPPAEPKGETEHTIRKGLEAVSPPYEGRPAYVNEGVYGDIIGVFFGLLATGSYGQAHELREGVCAAWRKMPPNGPFSGHASVGGVEVNLDRMCGLQN
jgi:hypothetical protein